MKSQSQKSNYVADSESEDDGEQSDLHEVILETPRNSLTPSPITPWQEPIKSTRPDEESSKVSHVENQAPPTQAHTSVFDQCKHFPVGFFSPFTEEEMAERSSTLRPFKSIYNGNGYGS